MTSKTKKGGVCMSIKLNYGMIKELKKTGYLPEGTTTEEIRNVYALNDRYHTFSAAFCHLVDAKVFGFLERTPGSWQHETTIKQNKRYKLTDDTKVQGFTRTHHGYLPVYDVDDCEVLPERSEEEKAKIKKATEKRKQTIKMNKTCEFCNREMPEKIETFRENKRICMYCENQIESEERIEKARKIYSKIKGISYDENRIATAKEIIAKKASETIVLTLERETSNEYDENAIKVLYQDKMLGYVDRDYTKKFARIIDNNLFDLEVEFSNDDSEITVDYFDVEHYELFFTISVKEKELK